MFLQFVLAGLGIFGATDFEMHETIGFVLHLPVAVLLLILALVSVRPLGLLGLAVLFSVLLFLQPVWVGIAEDTPAVGALHVVLAAVILGLGLYLAWRTWNLLAGSRSAPSAGATA